MARQPKGFDFTGAMRGLCGDIVDRVPELAHVDMTRVAVSFTQTRARTQHGIYATTTPLRFAGGARHIVRRGTRWVVPQLFDPAGREMLYILSFYLPRFLDLEFEQKLLTTVHELWHIGPEFNGDMRRFAGRCYAHGHSREAFDAVVGQLVGRYRAAAPAAGSWEFLRHDSRQLLAQHGGIWGTKIRPPRPRRE